mgnify:FL=1
MNKSLAPIALFIYNRPWHTQQTVEALQKNELANESELFIYSDAAKNEQASESVNAVREYIKTINGFKEITIILRDKNWGLADSIIDGVTEVVNKYGKIIVLEDDLVTSPYFLKFMNDALKFYRYENDVFHINGWNNPIDTDKLPNVYFSRIAYSWAWATWDNRWKNFNSDSKIYINQFSKENIKEFNIEGTYDMWGQMIRNHKKLLNTWAVFWNAEVFIKNKLALNNNLNLVKNIGTDGSGENCGVDPIYLNQKLNDHQSFYQFPTKIVHHDLAFEKLQILIKSKKLSLISRLLDKLKQ